MCSLELIRANGIKHCAKNGVGRLSELRILNDSSPWDETKKRGPVCCRRSHVQDPTAEGKKRCLAHPVHIFIYIFFNQI